MISFPLKRITILLAALGLGLGIWLVLRRIAQPADPVAILLVVLTPLICCSALAFVLDERGIAGFSPIITGCAIAILIAAFAVHDPKQIASLFGMGAVGLMIVGGYRLAKAARWRPTSHAWANGAIGLVLIAGLALYCVHYVAVSRDLMFSDFMYYRMVSIVFGSLLDQGQFIALVKLSISSMKDEYSLLPALAPGALLAATSLPSRFWYQGAVIVLYAAPAYFALGVLARDLARRAMPAGSAALRHPAVLALAIGAVFVAYPTGMAVVARGMPDIGGLVLVVAALRLSERLARLLALPHGHDARVGQLIRRTVLALALCLFGMFLFRRWYAFAAAGVLTMLALEVAFLAATRRGRFRWRDAIVAAALGGLILMALGAPVLVDWLPDPATHDYVTIYAAYRKEFSVVVAEICAWYGAALLALAVGCAIFLWRCGGDRRLLRLTCGSTLIAVLLFLRVQSPAVHHAYLLTPAFVASIGAAILILFERRKPAAVIAVAGLAAFTLTPAASLWAPAGLAPTAGQPPAPRSDLAELARLKAWVDANARPDHRYCVLASSYTINDVLVQELWQMDPKGSPLVDGEIVNNNVGMTHVDTRDGPPVDGLKDCAVMMVGDPVQTHLVLAYQQNVILPASEMLAGVGIGANYRRSGEVFNLEKGVKLVVFERVRPLDDQDIAALQARWRSARERIVAGLRGTSSD